jgi:hypothetical protein
LVVYAWHGEWLGVFILCIVGATATTMFKKLGKKEAK